MADDIADEAAAAIEYNRRLTDGASPQSCSAATEHADWAEGDYQRARDCMFQILGSSFDWPLQEKDRAAFDNAFQHAVGILSLTARRLPNEPQQVEVSEADVIIVAGRLRALGALKDDYGQIQHEKVRKALASLTLSRPKDK